MGKGRIIRPDTDMGRLILPRVGFIKIGMKDEHGYPHSVDYFIACGKYSGLFNNTYNDKPSTIQIVFPDDDASKVCNERYEYRDDDGRLIASGDGEIFKVWDGKKYESLSIKDYPNLMSGISNRYPNRLAKKCGDGWNITLTLTFIIPTIKGIAGVWQFATKGTASTIPQIRETFDGIMAERGFCKGIIFDLNVQFATTQKPGDKSKFPVVSLVPNESADNLSKVKNALQINESDNK